MKNYKFKTIAVLFVTTILFTTSCGAGSATDNNENTTSTGGTKSEQTNTLSEAEARQIALKQAGLETATFTKQEYDAQDNDFEFEFHADEKEYECEIDAKDGTVKNYDVENIPGYSDFLD